ncbi:MAG: ABC transporter ATP-binding protein, partial [Candidatus Limnocylindrales bacterium]
ENGAGKTTLMRILYGLTRPDSGELLIDGAEVAIRAPRDAIAAGVGMVTQHFSLVRPMTVAENLALGRGSGVRLDRAAAVRTASDAAERFGIDVRPDARIDGLSVGEQQRVEILKALSRDCRILIMDEPTAVLVPQEVATLFATLRRLAAEGMAVIFISHKLAEVMAVTDRVTVLRRGAVAGSAHTSDVDQRSLATMMVGEPMLATMERATGPGAGRPLLEVTGLYATGSHGLAAVRDVSFQVHSSEILAVAGVSGNGQSELVQVLSGMRRPTAGRVVVDGVEIRDFVVPEMLEAGVGRIAEDRHASVVGDLSVAYNLVLERVDDFRSRGRLDEAAIRRHADELIERFGIRASADDPVRTLSGGNMQKVLLARVLSRAPKVLVVSQPTRGLDVGATAYVHEQLRAQRDRGAAVLLVSEDLDELLALSDRLIVLYEGRIVGEVATNAADAQHLGLLMAGIVRTAA